MLQARENAAAARNRVQPPKGRILRIMQKAELAQKVAESKVIWITNFIFYYLCQLAAMAVNNAHVVTSLACS